ncbi:MAG: hypothetical protein M5U34_21585 [Chloroflexi bacterium]|nr:hypothetical protein [Chloroflexota bacterium]
MLDFHVFQGDRGFHGDGAVVVEVVGFAIIIYPAGVETAAVAWAMRATASGNSKGMPIILAKSLAEPMGRMPKGRVGWSGATAVINPLAASLMVPSPPAAMTASKPSETAVAANWMPSPALLSSPTHAPDWHQSGPRHLLLALSCSPTIGVRI